MHTWWKWTIPLTPKAGELEIMLADGQNDKMVLDREKVVLTRSRNWYKSRCEALVEANKELEQALVQTRAAVNFRPNRLCSTYGGYVLALRRNIAHASARATALMVAGDEVRGALTDPRTVVSYEHRLEVAKCLRSRAAYASSTPALEVHCVKCDATDEDSVDKMKVHVSTVDSVSVTLGVLHASMSGVPP